MSINKNKFINWLPAFAWMIIIFMFSAQPAVKSNELSFGFTKALVDVLGRILPFDIETSTINDFVGHTNHVIRKFAHFFIYLVLGILVSRALLKNGYKTRVVLISFLICSIYAASDELHQLFVPGRGCQLKDVLIDSTGAFIGISLNKLFYRVKRHNLFQ